MADGRVLPHLRYTVFTGACLWTWCMKFFFLKKIKFMIRSLFLNWTLFVRLSGQNRTIAKAYVLIEFGIWGILFSNTTLCVSNLLLQLGSLTTASFPRNMPYCPVPEPVRCWLRLLVMAHYCLHTSFCEPTKCDKWANRICENAGTGPESVWFWQHWSIPVSFWHVMA